MARLTSWFSMCPDCEKRVEILNGDFEFSMKLHKQQSHKPLVVVNKDLQHTQGKTYNTSRLTNKCDGCKEGTEIINDVSISFQLHAHKTKPHKADALYSSTSSGKIRFENKYGQSRKAHVTEKSTKIKNNKRLCENIDNILNLVPSEPLPSTSRQFSETTEINDVDAVYKELIETNAVIKLNARYLEREEEVYIFCKLCDRTPMSVKNVTNLERTIMSHITGKKHSKKALKELNNVLNKSVSEEQLPSTSSRLPQITKTDYFNAVFRELLKTNKTIKLNAQYVELIEDYYVCNLCNQTPIMVNNVSNIEGNIMSHITGKKHSEKVEKEIGDMLNQPSAAEKQLTENTTDTDTDTDTNRKLSEKTKIDDINTLYNLLLETNAVMKLNSRHLERGGDVYICKLCDRTPISVKNVTLLEKNIMNHITGMKHNKKLANEFDGMPNKPVPRKLIASTSRKLSKRTKLVSVNDVYIKLLETNAVIKLNARYFEGKGNVYICKLCDHHFIVGKKTNSLEEKLMHHIIGHTHNINVAKEFDDMPNKPIPGKQLPSSSRKLSETTEVDGLHVIFMKLLETNGAVKLNARYLEREGDIYICKLCDRNQILGNTFNTLKKNIVRHITGNKHSKKAVEEFDDIVNKEQLSNEVIQQNLKFLVREYGGVYCFLCKCAISLGDDDDVLFKNVSKHLEGPEHVRKKTSMNESDGFNETTNRILSESTKMDCVNVVFMKLLKTNAAIKLNARYFEREGNVYVCKLCDEYILFGKKIKNLEKNLVHHIFGDNHSKKPVEEFDNIINKTQISNEVIPTNRIFLVRKYGEVHCSLCKCTILLGDDDVLMSAVSKHLEGSEHVRKKTAMEASDEFNEILDKVQNYNTAIQTNRKFLTKNNGKVGCTLCECTLPTANEVDTLIINLTTHLEGTGHIKKKMANGGSNTSVSDHPPESVKSDIPDIIKEVFHKLPDSYKTDIDFISVSPIKGYLFCRLCNSRIHPRYLKEHLEELQHVQEKELARGPNLWLRSQHDMCDQNVIQNMGTLSSLLQTIELKSPWKKLPGKKFHP